MRNPEIHPEAIYHIYNRGAEKKNIFLVRYDYLRFINKIDGFATKYSINIFAYCLMPNHFHLLIQDKNESNKSNISIFMKNLQSSHGHYFNTKYKHLGHVFQGPFKNKIITDDSYLNQAVNYIHDNPVRKKYVTNAIDWPYSSANKLNRY